nr:Toll Interleukin receptor [Hymenolepis microstoma]
MFEPKIDTYDELLKDLGAILSAHPSDNLHLASTLDLFTTLREQTDKLACKTPTPSLIKIYGDENFINYYKQCLEYFVSEPKICALASNQSAEVKSFSKLHASLWNICRLHSTTGYWVCKKLSKHSVHDSLWRFVSCRDLLATKYVQKSETKLLISWSFGILLHILNNTQVSVDSYRSYDGVHILLSFLRDFEVRKSRSQSEYLKMCALLLLVRIVNETDTKSDNCTDNYVEYLLGAVRVALKATDLYSPIHKYHLLPLLYGLNQIIRFDVNKRILLENDILDDILTMLQIARDLPNSMKNNFLKSPIPNTNSDTLATEVIRLLWQLCFLSETLEQLPRYPSLLTLCREFNENSHSTICRETVEGLLWTLSKPLANFKPSYNKVKPLSATENPYGHIIFACNRINYRQSVNHIMMSLKRLGYNVYSEPDHLEMEHALENASALILCLSYSFSTSPYCRQQVLSALSYGVALVPIKLENSYQPEAWLQFLLATVIYIPFTEKDDFDESIAALSRALTEYGIVREVSNAEIDPENVCPSEMVSSPSISVANSCRSTAMKSHAGRGFPISFFSELSNNSTPTPSECPSISVSNSLQFSPFSTTLRPRSLSCSASQVSSSAWSAFAGNFDDGSHLTSTEDQELVLAYQAPSVSILKWDNERVQQWLEESGLSHYTSLLDWLDGHLLWELAWHRIRASDVFFLNLERSLNMSQQDQVLLSNALSRLTSAE